MLHQHEWIRGAAQSFGNSLHPPNVALLRLKLVGVHVARRGERAFNQAGQCDFLRLSLCVVRLRLTDLQRRRMLGSWKRRCGYRPCARVIRHGIVRPQFAQHKPVEVLHPPLECEAVHLDQVCSVRGRGEIKKARASVHQKVAPGGIRDDEHGREFGIDAGRCALDCISVTLGGLERVIVNCLRCGCRVADAVRLYCHCGLYCRIRLFTHKFIKLMNGERTCG